MMSARISVCRVSYQPAPNRHIPNSSTHQLWTSAPSHPKGISRRSHDSPPPPHFPFLGHKASLRGPRQEFARHRLLSRASNIFIRRKHLSRDAIFFGQEKRLKQQNDHITHPPKNSPVQNFTKIRTPSTTTRDRNLRFRDIVRSINPPGSSPHLGYSLAIVRPSCGQWRKMICTQKHYVLFSPPSGCQ